MIEVFINGFISGFIKGMICVFGAVVLCAVFFGATYLFLRITNRNV